MFVQHVAALILIAGLLASVRAATIHIRDNVDEVMNDLHRQGRWASLAALLVAVGTLLDIGVRFAT